MTNPNPMEQVAPSDYVIQPTPHHLNGTGPWTQWLQIARPEPGGGARVQLFNGAETFPNRAEAVVACVQLGRAIIDGKVPGVTVLI